MDSDAIGQPPKWRVINDDCWGNLDLAGYLFEFIDTPAFKRLKRLKQLGTCYEVWTGATHNRFEHSLGTCHLATRLLNRFRTFQQEEVQITGGEHRAVTLAALLHDLGHGILSHVFDNTFYPLARPGVEWKHEAASLMMFDYTVDSCAIDIPEEEIRMIKALIDGNPTTTQQRERGFLFDIVANKRNSIDTDKWDYITRDCRNLNMPGYDIERLMSNAWVMDNQICYAYKQPDDVLDFFSTRFRLHKKVYGHAVAKGYEFMYVDALLKADSYLGISESVNDPEVYVTMTDGIFDTIRTLSRTVPELRESAEILKKIDKRQHYRHVDAWFIPLRLRDRITEEVVTARAIASFKPSAGLKESEIIVDFLKQSFSPLDSGKNPVEMVKFYKKTEDVAVHINREHFGNVVPSVFEDIRVRCFLRDSDRARAVELQEVFRSYMLDLTRGLGDESPASQSEGEAEMSQFFTKEKRRASTKLQPNQLLTAGFGESSPRKRRLFGDRGIFFSGESTPNGSPERKQDRKRFAKEDEDM